MQWETVIGLEVHLQLATSSKIFSGSPTTFGADPNTQANAVAGGATGMIARHLARPGSASSRLSTAPASDANRSHPSHDERRLVRERHG